MYKIALLCIFLCSQMAAQEHTETTTYKESDLRFEIVQNNDLMTRFNSYDTYNSHSIGLGLQYKLVCVSLSFSSFFRVIDYNKEYTPLKGIALNISSTFFQKNRFSLSFRVPFQFYDRSYKTNYFISPGNYTHTDAKTRVTVFGIMCEGNYRILKKRPLYLSLSFGTTVLDIYKEYYYKDGSKNSSGGGTGVVANFGLGIKYFFNVWGDSNEKTSFSGNKLSRRYR